MPVCSGTPCTAIAQPIIACHNRTNQVLRMHRSAPRSAHGRVTRYVAETARRSSAPRLVAWGWLPGLMRVLFGGIIVLVAALVGPGILLDTPQPPLQVSDA